MSLTTSTIVKTVTDSDGWSLLGPLTTTFTPPSGCGKIFSTSDSSLALLGTDYFGRSSCFPSSEGSPIRVYFRPGLACPEGWTSELVSGARSTSRRLPSIGPDETVAVCCPSGLSYAETTLRFAPGVGGWCLGSLARSTTIEPNRCVNCDGTPTPLPVRNADGVAMTLVQTTLLLRLGAVAGAGDGRPALFPTSTASPSPNNSTSEEPPSGLPPAAKTGISVGVVIAVILLAFALGAVFIKRRRQRRQAHALKALTEAKEVDGTSATVTELIGDTNPHMKTYEPGKGAEVLSVAPVVYMEPVELASTPFNRYSHNHLPDNDGGRNNS